MREIEASGARDKMAAAEALLAAGWAAESREAKARAGGKRTILLVDDVQLFLEQEKGFLGREDFELLSARSGEEALKIAEQCRPDLILLDFYMPDMNGDHCCRLIKSSAALAKTPVVMVTGGRDQEDFEKSWQAGCDDIVVKPINGHYLRAVVSKHLPVVERGAPRFVARLRVQHGVNRETLLEDYSINLSTGGLFLESDRVLPVGSSLKLAFMLPDPQTCIRCDGKVAWINHPEMIKVPTLPPGMGIQFVNLSLEGMTAIRDFIKRGSLLPYW